MRDLFPIRGERPEDEGAIEKCRRFCNRYMHPVQIGTGFVFSAVGIGITAAGLMYGDGLNFAFESVQNFPSYVVNGGNVGDPAEYLRESYRSSMERALDIGWKLVPFYYSLGHYTGGKFRDKISELFRR